MTALVGYVDAGVGYLAADRQLVLGNVNGDRIAKIVGHRDPVYRIRFAAAGAPMLAYPAQLVDVPDVVDGRIAPPGPRWADRYFRRLLELGHPPLDRDGQLDGNLLVLTPGAVTLIGGTGWPSPAPTQGIALGSAGDFALGAFHGLRDTDPGLPVDEALQRAITIACNLSHAAGGGADVVAL
jgi:hypothetical protein